MERLNVYLCGRLVGSLERDDKSVRFRYLPEFPHRQRRRTQKELLDQVNDEHPSPVYNDIVEGIRLRIRQLDR